MRSSEVSAGTDILASQYNNLRKDAYGGAQLLVHEQSSPNMTVYVEPGVVYVGATRVAYAGGNSPTITAPVANPRIDLITINSSGTIQVTAGSEGASPAVPTYPSDKAVLAEVYLRVGSTTINDADATTNSYIQRDVRPFLGGAYISSNAQVASGAAIDISKISFNGDLIPTSDGAYDIGSASFQVQDVYAQNFYKNGVSVGGKFGGTGADGALSVTSGTTTISCGSAKVLVKNYTTIDITGTGKVDFSNVHNNGTLVVFKATGNVTLTSSTTPLLELSGVGAATDTDSWINIDNLAHQGVTGGTSASTGKQYTWAGFIHHDSSYLQSKAVYIMIGAGGGTSSSGSSISGQGAGSLYGAGGNAKTSVGAGNAAGGAVAGGSGGVADSSPPSAAGGRGGGGLLIECGGALNFTGTIYLKGQNGADGPRGGGGGGAGGGAAIISGSHTATSGTFNNAGGTGGTSGSAGGAGGASSNAGVCLLNTVLP